MIEKTTHIAEEEPSCTRETTAIEEEIPSCTGTTTPIERDKSSPIWERTTLIEEELPSCTGETTPIWEVTTTLTEEEIDRQNQYYQKQLDMQELRLKYVVSFDTTDLNDILDLIDIPEKQKAFVKNL